MRKPLWGVRDPWLPGRYVTDVGMPDAILYALIWTIFFCARRVMEKAWNPHVVMFRPGELAAYMVAIVLVSFLPLIRHPWRQRHPALSVVVMTLGLCFVCVLTFLAARRVGVINGVFAVFTAAAVSLDAHRKELYFRCLGTPALLRIPLWEGIVFGLCGLAVFAVLTSLGIIWSYDFGSLFQNQMATLQSFTYGTAVVSLIGWRCWFSLTGRTYQPHGWETVPMEPRVFLSHSSCDKAFVRRLASDLQANGVSVWFDEWELAPGDSLVSKIEHAIDTSGVVIAVISQNSIRSKWVRLELDAAILKHLAIEQGVRLIPVKIDDAEAPLFLKTIYWVDFHKEGYGLGFGKLLRGILLLDKPA